MARATASLTTPTNSDLDNANFKAMELFTQEALIACGWVQTTDVGQVSDYNTVTTKPTSSFEHWQIWAMGDTLQTSSPVFLKLEFGFLNGPLFAFTVGNLNGNGVVTGGCPRIATTVGYSTGSTLACYYSGDKDWINLALWPSNTSGAACFGLFIERSKDATGASLGDYTSVTTIRWSVGSHQICFKPNSYAPTIVTITPPIINIGAGSGSFGTSLAVSPCFPMVGGYGNPLLGIVSGQGVDFNEASTSVIQMYGVDHIYLSFKTHGSCNFFNGNHDGGCLLMRYE